MTPDETNPDDWPPPGCPPLAWPDLSGPNARLDWYRAVILAYSALWDGHSSEPRLAPVSETDLAELEQHLGCALPASLRQYHADLGALSLSETLCSVARGSTPIQPLLEAFPGIVDLSEDEAERTLARELIAFGDYLGNGNMFCFHRQTGEVYYFDHDDGAVLTHFFPAVDQYLDALMIKCLAEVHEDDETGEMLLVERFGLPLVRKWMY